MTWFAIIVTTALLGKVVFDMMALSVVDLVKAIQARQSFASNGDAS
jgi:hypothetical protein